MEPLGLAAGIIGIASLGREISKRLSDLPNFEGLRNLILQVTTTNLLLHELPEILRTLQGASTIASESLSGVLAKLEEVFKELLSVSETMHADMRRNRLKKSLTVYQSRHGIASISERLEQLKTSLNLLIQLVSTLLDKVLSKTLIVAIRVAVLQETTRSRQQLRQQEEYLQSGKQFLERSVPTSLYTTRLSRRQKQFLGRITFSLGKNYYIHLQHTLAETHGSIDDSIQDHDRTASDSVPLREILDEEVDPLTSSAYNKDQLRLLFVVTP